MYLLEEGGFTLGWRGVTNRQRTGEPEGGRGTEGDMWYEFLPSALKTFEINLIPNKFGP